MKKLALAALMLSVTAGANATIISDNTLSTSVVNTFSGLSSGNVAGTISQTGATYGERFAGQTLGSSGNFDTLSGSPTGPLTLLANANVSNNIGILDFNGSNRIYGDRNSDIGEGALSILLAFDTDMFGFDALGTDDGSVFAKFFSRTGSLLGSLTINSINDQFYGFRATAGELIAGVSLTTNDGAGLAYDNFRFNQIRPTAVPEPASLTLLSLGLLSVGFATRKRAAK